MQTPTLDQLKRALHISEAIEKLQAEMSSIFGEKIPKAAKAFKDKVLKLTGLGPKKRKKSKMSKAGREAIAAAQKARWAKVKGKTSKPAAAKEKPAKKKKGKMSAAGRARIVAAQKLRWDKVRAEKAGKKA